MIKLLTVVFAETSENSSSRFHKTKGSIKDRNKRYLTVKIGECLRSDAIEALPMPVITANSQ